MTVENDANETQKTAEELAAEETALAAAKAEVEAAELAKANPKKVDEDLIQKVVSERVEAELKEIKSKLDTAYKLKAEAEKKAAEFEKKERDATIQRLNEEGKHKEAFELEKAELKAENEKLKRTNTELSRDSSVRSALSGLDFRNEKAFDVAFKDIIGQLVQDDKGQWTHRTGVSIGDFINVYSKEETQSFLFKPKASNGGGSRETKNNAVKSDDTSLFSKTQEEVLAMAAAGKFNR